MIDSSSFDVIIIGGSYAGLSAAMSLGRSLRNVLVIDDEKPANRQTPHSHNFLTNDGDTPADLTEKAGLQVSLYPTISFHNGTAVAAVREAGEFVITADDNKIFRAKKLLFATGIFDQLPEIPGFKECWGISLLHCPYCHGYEVRNKKTGVIANGDIAYEFSSLINNWTKDLTLYTNGVVSMTKDQINKIQSHNITIIESEIAALEHQNGKLSNIVFVDGTKAAVEAVYTRAGFSQRTELPVELGCMLTEMGHLKVDILNRTTIPGIFAAGDNTSMLRSVAVAVAAGNVAGAAINRELIEETF